MTSNATTKVLVPENEYRAALTTLTNVILSSSTNDSDSSSLLQQQQQQQVSPLRKEIHTSIVETIEQSIEPIPTLDFEKMQKFASTPVKRQLQKVLDKPELHQDDLSVSSCSTDIDSESSHSASSDSEMDEDELLDQQVWERAKELRQNVRMASRRLQLVREEKLSQALSLVQREIEDLIRLEKEWNDQVEGNFIARGEDQDRNSAVHVEEMEEALKNVKKQLQDLENVLPGNVQALRDTIESVSYSLQKKMKHEMSRTERAIQLRDCDDVWRSMKTSTQRNVSLKEDETAVEKVDAAKRFAMFVSKV
jgi:hypothetical protein